MWSRLGALATLLMYLDQDDVDSEAMSDDQKLINKAMGLAAEKSSDASVSSGGYDPDVIA